MKMKDFEERLLALEAEIKTLKESADKPFVQWFDKEENKAAVISSDELVVPVLRAIIKQADLLRGQRIPKPLWDMARGVTDGNWTLTDKQKAFAFKLINTKNVDKVKDILVA